MRQVKSDKMIGDLGRRRHSLFRNTTTIFPWKRKRDKAWSISENWVRILNLNKRVSTISTVTLYDTEREAVDNVALEFICKEKRKVTTVETRGRGYGSQIGGMQTGYSTDR
jgi:hypothetical protein